MSSPLFGVFFVGKSYPITDQHFTRIDATHWLLDIATAVTPNYTELKECSLFLTQPNILDASTALSLYVKSGTLDWAYRGCVHTGHPSDVFPLQWPEASLSNPLAAPGSVQLGVSIELLAEAAQKEGSKLGDKEEFAKRVGMDLYRFLESFQVQRSGNSIVIPADALDRWLIKISDKLRRDPDFLTRSKEKF